jgi:hypothetical protein
MDFEDEHYRRGNFECIFPLENNIDYYEQFFDYSRFGNAILWAYVRSGCPKYVFIDK